MLFDLERYNRFPRKETITADITNINVKEAESGKNRKTTSMNINVDKIPKSFIKLMGPLSRFFSGKQKFIINMLPEVDKYDLDDLPKNTKKGVHHMAEFLLINLPFEEAEGLIQHFNGEIYYKYGESPKETYNVHNGRKMSDEVPSSMKEYKNGELRTRELVISTNNVLKIYLDVD